MENKTSFGVLPDGRTVDQLTLRAGSLRCQIITYGGALQSLHVPDRDGKPVDVLLGFDTLDGYLAQTCFIGALIGRYGNRIAGARFSLGGRDYTLPANEGENHLHGGPDGFDKRLWTVASLTEDAVVLTLRSPDGDMGYPGCLDARVTYRLTPGALTIEYEATSTEDSYCNLTNHAYFNLSGHDSGPVTGQTIQLFAGQYLPIRAGSIPTGELAPVAGTPMDLRQPQAIGARIDEDFTQLRLAGGYDHCWAVDGEADVLRPAARAASPETGIVMETLTTLPGVQFYAGNYLDGCPRGKGGAPYARRWGFCLETQFYPDAPHHPGFPAPLLRRGETQRSKTVYRFETAG